MRRWALCCGLVLACVGSGCGTMGPAVLKGNRAAYNSGIQQSDKEELLLNLVRVRYEEPPFFLSVGSISSSFNYQVDTGVGGEICGGPNSAVVPSEVDKATGMVTGVAQNFANVAPATITPTLMFQYYESPTITYTPLQGEKFVTQILTEIDLGRVYFLQRADVPIDVLLDVLVKQLSDMRNPSPAATSTPELVEERRRFSAFVRAMGELQETLGLQLRLGSRAEAARIEELLGAKLPCEDAPGGKIVCRLHLRRSVDFLDERRIVDGALLLSVGLRNVMEALDYLADGVEVPDQELNEGVALRLPGGGVPADRVTIRIPYSGNRPAGAFVAVAHNGHWFSIARNDMSSKRVFGFLMALLAMEFGDSSANLPVLTIPVGGNR